jgi:hemoglobin
MRNVSRILLVAALGLAACGGGSKAKTGSTTAPVTDKGAPPAGTKTLYDRLGGKDAIHAVVEDFIGNVAADTKINGRFVNADIPHLKQMLEEQVCAATGGPCKYSGKDMKSAHAGMKITDDDFGALVADLQKSLDKLKVGAAEQKDLLGALAGMKGDVVGQ